MLHQLRTARAILAADPADTALTALVVAVAGFVLSAMWIVLP